MKKKRQVVLGIIIALLAIGFMVYERMKPLEVKVLEVHPGSIASTFKEEGTVIPEIQQPVYSLYGGQIMELLVQEGQAVKTGDLLAVINHKELDFQLAQLYAQLKSLQGEKTETLLTNESQIAGQELHVAQARQDLKNHKLNFERIEQLHQANAVSQKDFDDAQAMLEKAQNQLALQEKTLASLKETGSPAGGTQQFFAGRVEALQAQADMLEYQKKQTSIVAPAEGIVSNLSVEKGEILSPVSFCMHIFQPGSCVVETYILTEYVHSISLDMKADLILSLKDEEFIYAGFVKQIAPSAIGKLSALGLEEQRVKVRLELEETGGAKLFPGDKLDVAFTTDQHDQVLTVPKTALFPAGDGDGDAVWVARKGKAAVQPVKTGFDNNLDVVITEGLSPGDLVILNPQLKELTEGKRVRVAGHEDGFHNEHKCF